MCGGRVTADDPSAPYDGAPPHAKRGEAKDMSKVELPRPAGAG